MPCNASVVFAGRVRDGFFLKEELIFAGVFTLFQSLFIRLVSGFIPFDSPSPDIYPWDSFYRSLFSSVGRLILATVTGWYPIAKSFTMKQSIQPTRYMPGIFWLCVFFRFSLNWLRFLLFNGT